MVTTTTPAGTVLHSSHDPGAPDHGAETPDGPGQGGRIRAARAAADLSREQLGAAIGSSARTVRRLEDEQRRVSAAELREIAAACRAPEWFLLHGWRGAERSTERRAGPALPREHQDSAPSLHHESTRGV